jgi:hypothetical protein
VTYIASSLNASVAGIIVSDGATWAHLQIGLALFLSPERMGLRPKKERPFFVYDVHAAMTHASTVGATNAPSTTIAISCHSSIIVGPTIPRPRRPSQPGPAAARECRLAELPTASAARPGRKMLHDLGALDHGLRRHW